MPPQQCFPLVREDSAQGSTFASPDGINPLRVAGSSTLVPRAGREHSARPTGAGLERGLPGRPCLQRVGSAVRRARRTQDDREGGGGTLRSCSRALGSPNQPPPQVWIAACCCDLHLLQFWCHACFCGCVWWPRCGGRAATNTVPTNRGQCGGLALTMGLVVGLGGLLVLLQVRAPHPRRRGGSLCRS